MASGKEVRSRIKSVRDTKKITNAMYLIASTKLQRARRELANSRPYFDALQKEIGRIFRASPRLDSRYYFSGNEQELHGACAVLSITADKGLAGPYNQNVLKETEKVLQAHKNPKLYVVGEFGRQYFLHRNIPMENTFLYTAQNPSVHRAREICCELLAAFDREEISQIHIVYTDMKNSLSEEVHSFRLLPFDRPTIQDEAEDHMSNITEFVPSPESVLENVIPSYLTGFIYSALVDSFCSEQSARMSAMNNANKNAEELLGSLQIQYNHIRQAAITQEITEVSAGAKAQKRKHSSESEVS